VGDRTTDSAPDDDNFFHRASLGLSH
jgi:hypothetical protein